jgi:hypothetical protein
MGSRTMQTAKYCASRSTLLIDAGRYHFHMGWIHASRDAAKMVDLQSGRNRATQQFIGEAMGLHFLGGIDTESPVSVVAFPANPKPAGRRLIHVEPKPFFREFAEGFSVRIHVLALSFNANKIISASSQDRIIGFFLALLNLEVSIRIA